MTFTIDAETLGIVIAFLGSVYKAITYLLDKYKVGSKRKENQLIKMGYKNMQREIIRTAHRDFTKAGSIDEDELEHIEQVYEIYHSLGGNGTAKR